MAHESYKQPKTVPLVPLGKPVGLASADVTVGNIGKAGKIGGVKTSGIKIRGTGAATKGTMARGPMA